MPRQTRNSPFSPFNLVDVPKKGEPAKARKVLEDELQSLQKNLPEHVKEISDLMVPHLLVDLDNGAMSSPPAGAGPWEILTVVSGGPKTPEYNREWRFAVRFNSLWPKVPPSVRFRCIIQHGLVDDDNRMLLPFYARLKKSDKGEYCLKDVLQHIHHFLEDPFDAWGIPANEVPSRIAGMYEAHKDGNAEHWNVIDKYKEKILHPDLFGRRPLKEEFFDPRFWKAHKTNTPEGWREILTEIVPGEVFSFPIFKLDFCARWVEEIFNFYSTGLPARRPNSMNNYGIILNSIGLEPFVDHLQEMVQPLGRLLFPGAGQQWDGHHCFIVRYRAGEDLGLDMHTDDSDVTFNVCFGVEFTGALLQFCGMMGSANHRKRCSEYAHVKGQCVVHLGRKRHGADDIASGERLNLILWNQSSYYRASDEYKNPDYEKENGPPDAVCVSYTHDRDYGNFKPYPKDKTQFKGRGWCPPTHAEYKGFKADAPRVFGG